MQPTILSSDNIHQLCRTAQPMISPFYFNTTHVHGEKVCSYGLQESSYDVTLSPLVQRFNKDRLPDGAVLSVEDTEVLTQCLEQEDLTEDGYLVLQPGEFVLGLTNEHFEMPDNVTGFLNCKSSLARLGMNMPYTTIKAGWKGYLVLEIQNTNSLPIALKINEGIGSIFFHWMDDKVTYNGQFQNQDKIQVTGK